MKIKRIICIVLSLILCVAAFCSCEKKPKEEPQEEIWTVDTGKFNDGKVNYTIDGDEVIATPVGDNKLGLDITDKNDIVSICYTMWHDAIFDQGMKEPLNVTELLKEYEFTAKNGFMNKDGKRNNHPNMFYYWGEPAQGYYRSTDEKACENNMTMLYNAGVDFIILDYTYLKKANYGDFRKTYVAGPMETLLKTIMRMRAEGKGTPYVAVWLLDNTLFDEFEKKYYSKDEYKDCFVYWNDKPLILRWQAVNMISDFFTVRGMQGLTASGGRYQWSYLDIDNRSSISYLDDEPEQMCCCVATQADYMSNANSAKGRDGGRFWNSHWKNVFEVRPKIVTVTWWNEWCAQELQAGGEYVFTDNFNQEYSRDIEPMKGGHGDQYYKWLVQYIHDYKNHWKCPELVTG